MKKENIQTKNPLVLKRRRIQFLLDSNCFSVTEWMSVLSPCIREREREESQIRGIHPQFLSLLFINKSSHRQDPKKKKNTNQQRQDDSNLTDFRDGGDQL